MTPLARTTRTCICGYSRLGKVAGRGRALARGRRMALQRVVGTLVVVALAIAGELGRTVRQVAPGVATEQLRFERAVEALLLALGLRMIRPAVEHADAEAQQPQREWRVPGGAGHPAPDPAVVAEDRLRQPVALERRGQ